ncbi:ATP-binding cassette domain-containing protein [Streptomyces rishiriensis]|uniref:ABC-type multidrug transport system ATPase subunit n=1 Tax=Streptomyces rishiriensis TaxID=68264 RepID=A0ABU0NXQ1_STRRH|nr:ATP-binding cassette domain-containing protein [Streptomyces rishiriensis]MDQ0583921.1 ABC-type multidrug transport system ATPase subunit [Streptomyces rishiriensis]
MIQAFGLTSNSRKALPPAVDDVSFEARAGRVTVLLGAPGAGKTTVLRLMLGLQQGRGLAYFRGRPLHRIAHPSREVGVLLGDVPGHPARTVRGHLRMLCAAAGVPARRADEVLEVVGLVSLRDERLGTLSRGMDRRLGLACALLADPHTLVLDDPADGLSGRESRWLYGMLRAHADQGGTVLTTTTDPKEAARTADRVVTLDRGAVVADQEAADFARTRLRPRVAVRSPHATRLAALLTREARAGQRSVEVVQEDGNRLSVYGSSCAHVGETAFRHDILVHQLADETGDMGPGAGAEARQRAHAAAEPGPGPTRRAGQEPAGGEPPTVASSEPGSERADLPEGACADLSEGACADLSEGACADLSEGACADLSEGARAASESPYTGAVDAPGGPGDELSPSPAPYRPVEAAPRDGMPTCGGDSPVALMAPAAAARAADTADAPASPTASAGHSAAPEWRPVSGAAASASAIVEAPRQPLEADTADATGRATSDAHRAAARPPAASVMSSPQHAIRPFASRGVDTLSALPPPISVRSAPSPLRPLRYELRRATGIGTGFTTGAVVLVVSALTAVLLAGAGHTAQARLLAAWPTELPLPPAALGAGLLGALAFGDEFRHPALAADRGTVPRRLGVLTAKLLVAALTALMLAFLTVGCDAEALYLVYGREVAQVPADWLPLGAGWVGLVIGCAWTGVLAAGVFRSTTAGLAAVVAMPVAVLPVVQKTVESMSVRSAAGFSVRLRELVLVQWPFGGERYVAAAARVIAQPVGGAMALSLTALLCAYLLVTLRSRV